MTLDEFMSQLAALSTQYTDACAEELAAMEAETQAAYRDVDAELEAMAAAHASGEINGKNAELRKLQTQAALRVRPDYTLAVAQHEVAVLARKAATMRRVGIEHEIKLWRAWLGGRDD